MGPAVQPKGFHGETIRGGTGTEEGETDAVGEGVGGLEDRPRPKTKVGEIGATGRSLVG